MRVRFLFFFAFWIASLGSCCVLCPELPLPSSLPLFLLRCLVAIMPCSCSFIQLSFCLFRIWVRCLFSLLCFALFWISSPCFLLFCFRVGLLGPFAAICVCSSSWVFESSSLGLVRVLLSRKSISCTSLPVSVESFPPSQSRFRRVAEFCHSSLLLSCRIVCWVVAAFDFAVY